MRCNQCQAEFDDELKACPECGAPVTDAEEIVPETESQVEEEIIAEEDEPSVEEEISAEEGEPSVEEEISAEEGETEELVTVEEADPQEKAMSLAEEFASEIPKINPLLAKTDALTKNKAFLALCILQTVATVFLAFGSFKTLQIIPIFLTAFLWIIFIDSKKGLPVPEHIRLISGSVFVYKIFIYILSVLSIACGVVFCFKTKEIIHWLTNAYNNGNELFQKLFGEGYNAGGEITLNDWADTAFNISGWIIGVLIIVAALFLIFLNHYVCGKIHSFIKSCYRNIITDENNLNNRSAMTSWLIVFAVIDVLLSLLCLLLLKPFSAIAFGCHTASSIIAFILIKKYYSVYK